VLRRALAIAVQIGLFVGFGACNYVVVGWWAARHSTEVPPTCLGPEGASRHVVYLHGLDSMAPSWQELDNRRALAEIPDAAIAIPRAPGCGAGRCWPDAEEGAAETIAAIRGAARACFGDHASYGVVGFSRGGFALARLATCNSAGARWAIVASAFGYIDEQRLRDCPVAVVIGRHDRYHHDGAVGYAQRRRAAELPTSLIEFDGGHRLDADSLRSAIDALERNARAR
jgi:pimeloyl-ACP methyl ester carboxylesterase